MVSTVLPGSPADSRYDARWAGLLLALSACAWRGAPADKHEQPPSQVVRGVPSHARSGVLRVLTYNVAGLPGVISASDPATNNLLASSLFNHHDLVLAQEDFAYHRDLVQRALHPYRLAPRYPVETLFGDGLCALSVYPLEATHRVRWASCNGYLFDDSDCFGEKGFSMAQAQLSSVASVHVYNLHAEAGTSATDVQTRREGFNQLTEFIKRHSAAKPIIVAGDTNLDAKHDVGDRTTLARFVKENGLVDACETTRCAHPRLDRVLYRSAASLELMATRYYEDGRFVDASGQGLSDHPAVAVELSWSSLQP